MNNQIHFLSSQEVEYLLQEIKIIKQKCIVLFMVDCGLRVSETVTLKWHNLDFKRSILTVTSLKKRSDKDSIRQIPISARLYNSLAIYISSKKIEVSADSYLFPAVVEKTFPHCSRKTVNTFLRRISLRTDLEHLHPHTLRHTFATLHLANGTSLPAIKTMLGHNSYNTTLVYTHIPLEQMKKQVKKVTNKKLTWLQRIKYKISPPERKIINIKTNDSYTVGRGFEVAEIDKLIKLNLNILVLGRVGVGKSHLLRCIDFKERKIIRLDDTESIKKSLGQILLYLYGSDKKGVMDLIWENFTKEELEKRVQRENAIQLCDLIRKIVEPKEYILLIDDISNITNSAKKILEKLKDTFTIISSAREMKANNTSFLWNFEIIKIKGLKRLDALKLINERIKHLQLEPSLKQFFINHIFEQTNGNPRAITELADKYNREPIINKDVIKSKTHTGALPEYDFTFIIVIFLGFIMAMRYASREFDEPALRLIGSIGLILLLVSRPIIKSFTKKFL